MSPKERFAAALNHKEPDRIPLDIMGFEEVVLGYLKECLCVGSEEEVYLKLGIDFRKVSPQDYFSPKHYHGPLLATTHNSDSVTYWGTPDRIPSTTLKHVMPYGDAVADRPLREASSIEDVDRFPWPDPNHFDYQEMEDYFKPYSAFTVRIVSGPLFNRVCQLAGMTTVLENMLFQPAIVEAITERITEFYYQFYRKLFTVVSCYLDEFHFWDDVATDRALFFRLELWKRFFKRPLAKIFSLAKDFGLKMHYHCYGMMKELIPDLLDIGMDILEPCQFHLTGMDAKVLKREFGKDLTFYGGINTQKTLPFGTPEEVRREVRERVKVVGRGGGYILAPDHTVQSDIPVDNLLAMYEEASRYSAELYGTGHV